MKLQGVCMSEANAELLRYIQEVDVPESTVDHVLNRLQSRDSETRFSQTDWNRIKDKKPHLFHFIDSASREASPEDPILRAKVASALLGMVVLSEELRLLDLEKGMDQAIAGDIDINILTNLYPQEEGRTV